MDCRGSTLKTFTGFNTNLVKKLKFQKIFLCFAIQINISEDRRYKILTLVYFKAQDVKKTLPTKMASMKICKISKMLNCEIKIVAKCRKVELRLENVILYI